MKVVLIALGSETISGLDEAFQRDLVERVDGMEPEAIVDDVKQFIETWTPDLLVIAEAGSRQGGKIQAALIVEELRKGKLLKQPAIFVGNFVDSQAIELLNSGVQALLPINMDAKTRTYGVSSELLRTQAINLTNLTKGQATKNFKLGAFTVMPDSNQVYIFDTQIPLTKNEAALFGHLIMAKGQVLTKEAIYSNLYAFDNEVEMKIIDVFICKLRKKLVNVLDILGYKGEGVIATVWGRGYQIDLTKVPGLGEIGRQEFLSGVQKASRDLLQLAAPTSESASASSPAYVNGNGHSNGNGNGAAHNDRSIMEQIRDCLHTADFKERDADIRNYVSLARQAMQEGTSIQELFNLFGGCFEPLWERGGKLDAKTFGFHLANPDRLRFYRVNPEAIGATSASTNGAGANLHEAARPGPTHGINGRTAFPRPTSGVE